jgi:hypothetical protein
VLETLRPVTAVLRQAGLIGPEPGALSMAYGVEIE